MVFLNLFSETPDILSKTMGSFSSLIPTLIILMLLIGIVYWLRALQKAPHTEIRVYRRP